jgi:hypothetical protein
MYQLLVFYPEQRVPHETIRTASAAETLDRITAILAEHHDCEKVVVMFDGDRLFSVDCSGNRLP